ncbi:MAG: hypothetical protein J6B98_00860 [Bacilli bacterium]|nr:hypothetical protein [Bacilli bacterium]
MVNKLEIIYELTDEIKNNIIDLVKCIFLKSSIILLLVQIAVYWSFSYISLILYIATILFTLTFIFIKIIYNKQFIDEKKTIILDENIIIKNNNEENITIDYSEIKNIYYLNNIYCIATNKQSIFMPVEKNQAKKVEKILLIKSNVQKIKYFNKTNIIFLYINEILLVFLIIFRFLMFLNAVQTL